MTIRFRPATRQQDSILAPLEKRTLTWLASQMPAWINSDHLTALGFAGMILTGAAYYGARWDSRFLLVTVATLAINWFGDSLDGTLARYRNRQRPRYGFYVDHMVDAFGVLALISGLGASGYMSPRLAMVLLIVYYLLSIEIYLATYTVGVFKISFGMWGPTELRVFLASGNLLLINHRWVGIGGHLFLAADIGAAVAIPLIAAFALAGAVRNAARLYVEERLS